MVRPLAELSNREGAVCRTLPVPRGFEIGVVAGDDDGKVSIESTKLDGIADHVVVHARHVFIIVPAGDAAARSSPFSTPGASFIDCPHLEKVKGSGWKNGGEQCKLTG